MSNLIIEIKAPELTKAITALANALNGNGAIQEQEVQQPIQPQVQPLQQEPQPQARAPIAPVTPVQPPVTPVQQPVTPVQPVPTQVASYTAEQLALAATQLVDAGRRNELVQLLQSFGVSALTQLPKERYGEFATALRQRGVKL